MGYFDLNIDEAGPDVVVISLLNDEASPDDIARLRAALESHLHRGFQRFVFDCSVMQHFSSAFIGAVVATLQVAREHRTVAIVGTPRHTEILEVCRLDKWFPVLGDMGEALTAVRRGELRDKAPSGSGGRHVPAPSPDSPPA